MNTVHHILSSMNCNFLFSMENGFNSLNVVMFWHTLTQNIRNPDPESG
jgi:hypothetical protein